MNLRKLSIVIAAVAVALFSLLQYTVLEPAGNRVYDLFLRARPFRTQTDNIVFLNIDDAAIAKLGVFPVPRSVYAYAMLRLKEFGTRKLIYDIEFIDQSPTQIDEVYLRGGLRRNHDRRFSEIGITATALIEAVAQGRLPPDIAVFHMDELIAVEREALFADTLRIVRDDDLILSQSAALFGRAWGTLNVQTEPLFGEQEERRYMARERFSYPIRNYGGIIEGINAGILPALPQFSQAVRGAGYTNVELDSDGVRRRVFLTHEAQGYWFLQLAFAPLMEYWGRPEITATPRRLTIAAPHGNVVVPLDANGAMLINWPRENYFDSYLHASFVEFTWLEEYQANIEEYLAFLVQTDRNIFPFIAERADELLLYFEMSREARYWALEHTCSDTFFNEYVAVRNRGLESTREFLDILETENYIIAAASRIIRQFGNDPEIAAFVEEEADFCFMLLEFIETELDAFFETNRRLHERFYDAIVIAGRVDTGTTDIGVNPFHGDYINVGTHAVVLDNILTNSFINPLPFWWSLLFTLLFVPLVLVGTAGLKTGLRSVLGLTGVLLAALLPLGLFVTTSAFLAPLGAVLAMTTAVIARELIAFVKSDNEKRFIRQAFSTYLSPDVVAELVADPSKLSLGGDKREMTALFSDLAGFSSFSEKLDPASLVRLLNKYLTLMSNIILDNKGTIDKYVGDAIVAFFGAPIQTEEHARLACRSALAMMDAERELNKTIVEEGLSPMPLTTRIGLNTGDMVVGNMGAENKMNYTIMGNEVNLAARLEGVNKQYNTGGILISGNTQSKLGDEFLCRRLDRVRVMGINMPVALYELIELSANVQRAETDYLKAWDEAMTRFEGRHFDEAAKLFDAMAKERPEDGVAAFYRKRSAGFLKSPPPDNWDGVFNLDKK